MPTQMLDGLMGYYLTEIYARTDTETKRKAIENAYPDIISGQLPDWSKDKELLIWLSELK